MNLADSNPNGNRLPKGVSEKQIKDAIDSSGYPLQLHVARLLRSGFNVQEEWTFIDRDTSTLRAIDLSARRILYEFGDDQPRIRPHLDLLIECKQTELPYIFFLSDIKPTFLDFPQVAGLADDRTRIHTDDDRSTWTYSVLHALDLDRHTFINEPDVSFTFSKSVRKGKSLELSGSDGYNSLVLPLMKSLYHFQKAEAPPSTAIYFDAHLVVCMAVIDGPMVGVTVMPEETVTTLTPWVRVIRHEYDDELDLWRRSHFGVIDIVHVDFLNDYIEQHLIPFAEEFSRCALNHDVEIAEGKAFVSGMGTNWWQTTEDKLRPIGRKSRISRLINYLDRS